MLSMISCVVIGLVTGIISGLIGIGGGIILIPAFVYFFGFTQKMAQGTTLALMVPPIGLLAAWTYYQHGAVDLKVAALVCLGFFFGGLLGAKLAVNVPNELLRKVFGVSLILIGARMVFFKN